MFINCFQCNKEVRTLPCFPNKKFCSRDCHYKYATGKKLSDTHVKKIRDHHNTIEYKEKSRLSHLGQKPWNKGIPGPRGEKAHHWKNGKTKQKRGYVLLNINGKKFYEHRVVMEKHLGRPLTRSEVVHHINKKLDDNRLENLMLFKDHSDHVKHHINIRKNLSHPIL